MKRMNLREVPDDVYADLLEAADSRRQSLNAYVVERLTEVARTAKIEDYLATYPRPSRTRITLEEAAEAVRQVREAS
jgi:hypothetical protein